MTLWSPCCMLAALRLRVLLDAGFTRHDIIQLARSGNVATLADPDIELWQQEELGR